MQMKKIVESLQLVKTSLPVNCTYSNLRKLKYRFTEYQKIIASLPEDYEPVKKEYQGKFNLLKLKIDAIEANSHSQKAARYYFKDVLQHIQVEIDSIISVIGRDANSS